MLPTHLKWNPMECFVPLRSQELEVARLWLEEWLCGIPRGSGATNPACQTNTLLGSSLRRFLGVLQPVIVRYDLACPIAADLPTIDVRRPLRFFVVFHFLHILHYEGTVLE